MKRKHYTDEQEQVFLDRAHEYLAKNPDTTRGKLATYSGVSVSVLERLENDGKITLPPKLTIKEARATSPWAKGKV